MTSRMTRERCAADGKWLNDPLQARLRDEAALLRVWSRREYRIRYRQSLLGLGWAVLQPLATLAVYGTVLAGLLGIDAPGGLPYASFAFAGLVPWTFVASAIAAGVPATVNASSLISKVYFPREVIPLSVALACSLDLAIATVILLLLSLAQGISIGPALLALLVIDAILVLWVAAGTIFAASLTVFVRDLRHVLPFALQLLFFASPIMYPSTLLPARWRWLEDANPLAYAAEATRDAVLRNEWPDVALLCGHLTLSSLALILAVAYTRSVEPRMVDVV